MPSLVSLQPADGLSPRIGLYFAQMEDIRRVTKRYVSGLTPEQLSWSPPGRIESIGTQLLHIAAVERSWIGEDIERRPMGEEWAIAFPFRTNIPQVQGKPRDYFLEQLDAVRGETRAALARLTDADLAREIELFDNPTPGERFSIEWILYHLIEHEAHHRGQIALLKRLLP